MSAATSPCDVDVPVIERGLQLEPAAADERNVGATDFDGGIGGHEIARLGQPLICQPHLARHDEPPRPVAAADQAAVHQELVDADPFGGHQTGQARPTTKTGDGAQRLGALVKWPQLAQRVVEQLSGALLGGGQAE